MVVVAVAVAVDGLLGGRVALDYIKLIYVYIYTK